MKPFKIISHRRSGTHFLWETMLLNFDVVSEDMDNPHIFKSHVPYSEAYVSSLGNQDLIYIVRDGRDTLVANYHYWRRPGEQALNCHQKTLKLSFSDYLRGKGYMESCSCPFVSESFKDPSIHWADHAEWTNYIPYIRFEDLKSDSDLVITSIAKQYSYKLKNDKVVKLNKLVGHFPRKGIKGDWKNYFSKSDLYYFWDRAGAKMVSLGYTLEL